MSLTIDSEHLSFYHFYIDLTSVHVSEITVADGTNIINIKFVKLRQQTQLVQTSNLSVELRALWTFPTTWYKEWSLAGKMIGLEKLTILRKVLLVLQTQSWIMWIIPFWRISRHKSLRWMKYVWIVCILSNMKEIYCVKKHVWPENCNPCKQYDDNYCSCVM